MMQEKRAWRAGLICLLAFTLPVAIMFILYKVYHFAPFGNKSFGWMDGNICHIQYFAYLKDVLSGKNQISYTLSHCLGGTYLGTFSTALSSPFNLLVIFFKKEELHSFFDLVISLKLGAAGATMAYYLYRRFNLHIHVILALALGYALSQYCIAQSSLIYWHEGVYLLPMILLGVFNLVREGKIVLLSTSVALSLVLNWYTGCLNCLFSTIMFCFEFILFYKKTTFTLFIRKSMHYVMAMCLGLLLSACLFLPTVAELLNGAGGRIDLTAVRFFFRGNPVSAFGAFSLGALSAPDCVSLFCGSVVLVGCLGVFNAKNISHKKRHILIGLIVLTLLLFYWEPFYFLFSLLLPAESFWYRYSYVGIFALVFIAAYYYQHEDHYSDETILLVVGGWAIFLLAIEYARPSQQGKNIYATLSFLFACAICFYWSTRCSIGCMRKVFSLALLVLTIFEMGRNTRLLMKVYYTDDVKRYANYVQQAQKQLNEVKSSDKSLYRISQNTPRNSHPNGLTAFYNEPVAFNYASITGYTSIPDGRHLAFLDALGYRAEAQRITIVNTSIVAADALLGVKYYLSAYPINGLQVLPFEKANNKLVYYNKYALPMAFVFKPSSEKTLKQAIKSGNPFLYQNSLYGKLLGEEIELYKQIPFNRIVRGNIAEYVLGVPDGEYAFYGNFPWFGVETEIWYDNRILTPYARWLSPSVVYIPIKTGKNDFPLRLVETLQLRSAHVLNDHFASGEQFYALDLKRLDEVSQKLKAGAVADFSYHKSDVRCTVQSQKGEYLYLSFPYHKGWTILRNGVKIEPILLGNCMMILPLTEGKNEIVMHFMVPGVKLGLVLSCIGAVILCLIASIRRKCSREC